MADKRVKTATRKSVREVTAPTPKAPKKPVEPGAYVLENQIGFRLRRAHQRATEVFNRVMAEHALTPTQFAAIAKLDDEGPISQNHLGRLTAMDPATILGVVGRLSRQGLVAVRPDPVDGRATLLSLTAAGATLVMTLKKRGADVTREVLSPLSPAETEVLIALLGRIG